VAARYGIDPQTFRNRRGESIGRDVAAWLSRQLTSCTLRELAAVFGLGHADSVRNQTRRAQRALPDSSKLRQDIYRLLPKNDILALGCWKINASVCRTDARGTA